MSTVVRLEVRCAYCAHPLPAREYCTEYIAETIDYVLAEGCACMSCILSKRFVERTLADKGEEWTRTHLKTLFEQYAHEPTSVPAPREALLGGGARELFA